MMNQTIKSFVGAHPVLIYTGCTYDPAIRKWRGGHAAVEIPYAGRMLSASVEQTEAAPVTVNGVEIPTMTPQVFTHVDDLPPVSECDLCIVSAMYAAACRALGRDTSRLLTIGGVVVDDDGRVVGTVGFNRN